MKTFIKTLLLKIMLVALLAAPIIMVPDISFAADPSDWVSADAPLNTGDQGGRTALNLFDYSLGLNNNNNCLSCSFIQQFIVALASFSAAVFMYFRAFFVALLPLLMATWIAWNVGRLMVTGASDGKEFMGNVIKKATLFFFLWLVMINDTGSTSTDPTETMTITDAQYPWSWFGPIALDYGFTLGNEVRDITTGSLTMSGVGAGSGDDLVVQAGFNCENIGALNPQLNANPDAYGFAWSASSITCAIERTHMVGIAAGLAMIEGSWSQIVAPSWSGGTESVTAFFMGTLNAVIITIIGLALLIVFALSAIWFIFLVLDIVVKVLIIAALSPLLMLFALLQPTRQYAWSAVKGVIGALVTALGLAIVASLAFFLIMNTVNVYNTAITYFNPNLEPIDASNGVAGLREFIYRMQLNDPSDEMLIPMNLTTPWFHYLILVSLAIYALGKKIISMIESIIGARALSEMADNAKKLAVLGGAMGLAGAFTGYQATKAAGSATLTAGGLGLGLAGGAANRFGPAAFRASDRLRGMSSGLIERNNPFGAFRRNNRSMGPQGRSAFGRAGDVKDRVQQMSEEITSDGP